MLFNLIFILKILITEGRVFCQDSYAIPWRPMGNSCPASCYAVLTAVNRLKLLDYQKTITEKVKYLNLTDYNLDKINADFSMNDIIYRKSNKNSRLHAFLNFEYKKLIKNKNFIDDLELELTEMAQILKNGTYEKMADVKLSNKSILRIQLSAYFYKSKDLLQKVTNILNKYTDKRYMFDNQMTKVLLEELLSNPNLRFGTTDVKKFLYYLNKALRYQYEYKKNELVITLKSKDCLTIRVSGCFCKPGYVEQEGQCVKPSDCINNPIYLKYLKRIPHTGSDTDLAGEFEECLARRPVRSTTAKHLVYALPHSDCPSRGRSSLRRPPASCPLALLARA